ncbi:MAG: hypothetical protein BJ554DRAFT_5097 [Olpidium bornovanus]|uniref:Uncharacterized protein n=1 Tax=Olpidium bornovanus TaxID=278681 RepID=A0A8H7ZM07_9FUNG|nr:MAG: hypothetical protein BJ554DRAFT_5097 [Olpidium bornovanus]
MLSSKRAAAVALAVAGGLIAAAAAVEVAQGPAAQGPAPPGPFESPAIPRALLPQSLQDASCVCPELEKDGHAYIRWIAEFFHDCVYTSTEVASFFCGLATTLIWFIAQLPQICKNFHNREVDGLSKWLLIIWCAFFLSFARAQDADNHRVLLLHDKHHHGRAARLLHPVLLRPSTERAAGRVASAAGEPDDAVQGRRGHFHHGLPADLPDDLGPQPLPAAYAQPGPSRQLRELPEPLARDQGFGVRHFLVQRDAVLSVPVGLLFAVLIPQILENYRRKSVLGLSLAMFGFAIAANVSYGTSIVLRLPAVDASFWSDKFPFLLGSFGTLIFDIIIMIQAAAYGFVAPAAPGGASKAGKAETGEPAAAAAAAAGIPGQRYSLAPSEKGLAV